MDAHGRAPTRGARVNRGTATWWKGQGGTWAIYSHTGQQMRHRGNKARHRKPHLYGGGNRQTDSTPSGHLERPSEAGVGAAGRGENKPGFCSHGLGSMSHGEAAQLGAPHCMAVPLRERAKSRLRRGPGCCALWSRDQRCALPLILWAPCLLRTPAEGGRAFCAQTTVCSAGPFQEGLRGRVG